jgi:hypothetical protein
VFSCSESEQKQLNTWVSFQSAEKPLLGQFWVSGNTRGEHLARLVQHSDAALATFLEMAKRNSSVMRTTLPSLRNDLMRAVSAIDCCLSAVNEPEPN